MAGERALPGLGLRGFYSEGSDGWGVPLSEDLRKLSALTQLVAETISAMSSGDPDGTVRLDPADGAIVVRDNGQTIRIPAREGMTAYVKSTASSVRYLPGSGGWIEVAEGGSGGGGDPLDQSRLDLALTLAQLVAVSRSVSDADIEASPPGSVFISRNDDPAYPGWISVKREGFTSRYEPANGWLVYLQDEGIELRYSASSSSWTTVMTGQQGPSVNLDLINFGIMRAAALPHLVVESRTALQEDINVAATGSVFISRADSPSFPGWIAIKNETYTSSVQPENGWTAHVRDEDVKIRYSAAEGLWQLVEESVGGGGEPVDLDSINAGLRRALALSQIVAESSNVLYAAAVAAITDGQIFIIPESDPDHPNAVLARIGGVTDIIPAADGWLAYVKDADAEVRYSAIDTAWISTEMPAADPVVLYRPEAAQPVRGLTQADFDGSAALEVTTATDSVVMIPVGITGAKPLIIVQGGAGRVEVQGDSGVTVQFALAARTRAIHSVLTVLPIAANRYVIAGDVE